MMETKQVSSFWKIDDNRVAAAFSGIVIVKLLTEASDLDAHGGVELRVKVRRTAENLSGDLIFLQMPVWMFQSVGRQIP